MPHLHTQPALPPSQEKERNDRLNAAAITMGMQRHPLFASAVASVCCGSRPLWLASMLRARHSNIAEIEKIMRTNPIAPFSKTIQDETTRPPPCVSPYIVDDAAELELQKMR